MDHISLLANNLKTASHAGKAEMTISHSKLKERMLGVLYNLGYIKSLSVKQGARTGKIIVVELAYASGKPRITDIVRVSKLSKRIYRKAKDLKPYKSGYGHYLISTPTGVLSDVDARKANVGGEVLIAIW